MINFFKSKYKSGLRGFTLIELLVSMALFTTVITIAVGALFSAQAVNTKLEQTQLILDGVNLATELMARDLRYGTDFNCTTGLPSAIPQDRKSCLYPTGGTSIVFKPSVTLPGSTDVSTDRVLYYVSNGAIFKDEYTYVGGAGGTQTIKTYQITPNDVSVKDLTFYVVGARESGVAFDPDLNQPLVTFVISGVTVPNRPKVPAVSFTLQTSVSSRGLDI